MATPASNDTAAAAGVWFIARLWGLASSRLGPTWCVFCQCLLGAPLEFFELPEHFVLLGFDLLNAGGGLGGRFHWRAEVWSSERGLLQRTSLSHRSDKRPRISGTSTRPFGEAAADRIV